MREWYMPIKGQSTVEYMLIMLVALALLGLSIGVLISLNTMWNAGISNQRYIYDKSLLTDTVEEICYLGDGNSRLIHISGQLNLTDIKSDCVVEGDRDLYGSLYIYNDKGKVIVKRH